MVDEDPLAPTLGALPSMERRGSTSGSVVVVVAVGAAVVVVVVPSPATSGDDDDADVEGTCIDVVRLLVRLPVRLSGSCSAGSEGTDADVEALSGMNGCAGDLHLGKRHARAASEDAENRRARAVVDTIFRSLAFFDDLGFTFSKNQLCDAPRVRKPFLFRNVTTKNRYFLKRTYCT